MSPPIVRYLLWQVPGWAVTALVLALIVWELDLAWWIVGAGVAVLIARDLALYPAMRSVFRPVAAPQPIGAVGVAVEGLSPSGYVRVNGELWLAEARGPALPRGSAVVVRGARGLTLLVERAPGEDVRAL